MSAQVSGLIVAFGEDVHSPSKVTDYCSVVEKDAVLARIDPTAYEAALEQAEAALQQSEASLVQFEVKARKRSSIGREPSRCDQEMPSPTRTLIRPAPSMNRPPLTSPLAGQRCGSPKPP